MHWLLLRIRERAVQNGSPGGVLLSSAGTQNTKNLSYKFAKLLK
jgi:hypothetical protein